MGLKVLALKEAEAPTNIRLYGAVAILPLQGQLKKRASLLN